MTAGAAGTPARGDPDAPTPQQDGPSEGAPTPAADGPGAGKRRRRRSKAGGGEKEPEKEKEKGKRRRSTPAPAQEAGGHPPKPPPPPPRDAAASGEEVPPAATPQAEAGAGTPSREATAPLTARTQGQVSESSAAPAEAGLTVQLPPESGLVPSTLPAPTPRPPAAAPAPAPRRPPVGAAAPYADRINGDRACTDLPCAVLFLLLTAAIGGPAASAFGDGDFKRLVRGSDSRGELCGVGAAPSGMPEEEWKLRQLLWRPAVPEAGAAALCVDACPQSGSAPVASYLPGPSRYPVRYWSYAAHRRCMPLEPIPQDAPEGVAAIAKAERMDNPVFRGAADLSEAWLWVLLGTAAAGVTCFVLLCAVAFGGGTTIGCGAATAAVACMFVGAAACIMHSCEVADGCLGKGANEFDESSDWSAWFGMGAALAVAGLLLVAEVCLLTGSSRRVHRRDRNIAAELCGQASDAVARNCSLIALAAACLAVTMGITALCAYIAPGLMSAGKYQELSATPAGAVAADADLALSRRGFFALADSAPSVEEAPSEGEEPDPVAGPAGLKEFKADAMAESWFWLLLVISLVWGNFLSALTRMVAALTTIFSYWDVQVQGQPPPGVCQALCWAVMHSGSLAFSAMLWLPLQLASFVLRIQLARGEVPLCLLRCSPLTLAALALLGDRPVGAEEGCASGLLCGFIKAGRSTAELFNPLTPGEHLEELRGKAHVDTVLAAAKCLCGIVGAWLAWQLLRDEGLSPRIGAAAFPIAITGVASFMAAGAVLSVFAGVVDALVISRAYEWNCAADSRLPPVPDPPAGVRTLVLCVWGEGQNADLTFAQLEGSREDSDCGTVKVAQFRVFAERPGGAETPGGGADFKEWEIIKPLKDRGTWVRPVGDTKLADTIPGLAANSYRVTGRFWARQCPEDRENPAGTIYVRYRHQRRGMLERAPAATAVGPRDYTDSAWMRLYAFQPVGGGGVSHSAPRPPSVWELQRGHGKGRYQLRLGCRVTLYQSAHVGGKGSQAGDWTQLLPQVTVYDQQRTGVKRKHQGANTPEWHLDDDASGNPRPYVHRNCWEELYHAILSAKHFIYVCGWSLCHETKLLRERPVPVDGYPDSKQWRDKTIGELLKLKAKEKVTVLVMIWQEVASGVDEALGVNLGVGTHSAQTVEYFRGSGVQCMPLYRLDKKSATSLGTAAFFSHHQKCVVMDQPQLVGPGTPAHPDQRRVVAFLGGLDITKGRWDNPAKRLFNSPCHNGDFYNGCGISEGKGPRQPWQDIHAKIEGPAARDVADNFERRWLTQVSPQYHDDLFGGSRDEGLRAAAPTVLAGEQPEYCQEQVFPEGSHPESWCCQVLRSIDALSDKFHWDSEWARRVEHDIELAYINAIRQAERFIYIENQYFLGSSEPYTFPDGFVWEGWQQDVGGGSGGPLGCLGGGLMSGVRAVRNELPREITRRIVQALTKGQQSPRVYVCIPMFPEGVPESPAMQEIVHWQYRTMVAMYRSINQAIIRSRAGGRPEDYLLFFCLGAREPQGGDEAAPQLRSRHMIYVHSKMMVVDDEYIIAGSANINDRSLAGDRDTEICFGAFQPAYARSSEQPRAAPVRGAVHAFRVSVWGEHLGIPSPAPTLGADAQQRVAEVASIVQNPDHPGCVQEVRKRAQVAWEQYRSDQPQRMECHLMWHPTGAAALAEACNATVSGDLFPDTSALVVGRPATSMPDWITT